MINKYEKEKELIRQKAIEWQNDMSNNNYSYLEIANKTEYFYKKSKKYGLVKEFKENAII